MSDAMLRPQWWIGVELRHFVALEVVAQEASFNRAAAKLGYTQSAISQQIAALERVVGQKLIERPAGAQPLRLTQAGEILLEHAHAIGARLASAQADLKSLNAGDLDPLRLGFPGRGIGSLMPGILRRLQQDHDDLTIRVVSAADHTELLDMVRRSETHLAFVERPVAGRDEFEYTALLEDDYVLVVRRGEDADRAPATAGELASLPLIAFKGGEGCQLTEYFHSHDLEPSWVIASDDLETIYAAVTAGLGVALLPRLATICLGADVEVRDLGSALPPRRIGLAWSKARGRTRPAEAFVTAAVSEAARIASRELAVAS